MRSFDFYYAMPDRTLKRLRLDLIEVTVPFGKLRKYLCLQRLVRFRKPDNNARWLGPSKIFQKKGGGSVYLGFGVCVVKWRNTVYMQV